MLKNKEVVKSTTYSFLIHAALFVLIAWKGLHAPGEESPKQTQPPESITAEIVAPPKSKESETSIQKVEKEEEAMLPVPSHLTDECKDFFGGIGITNKMVPNYATNRYDAVVSEIFPGYPASKSGIQINDVLLDPDNIRGEIGTHVSVPVLRNGEPITFDLIRDKICTEAQSKGANP